MRSYRGVELSLAVSAAIPVGQGFVYTCEVNVSKDQSNDLVEEVDVHCGAGEATSRTWRAQLCSCWFSDVQGRR